MPNELAEFWKAEYCSLARAGVEKMAELGCQVDPAERIIEAAEYRESKLPIQESVAIDALKNINKMLGNAIGSGALRPPIMSESDRRFFWIFDITKEALSKIENKKS